MFFTQEDYIKIQQWLAKNSVKDTEFNEANIPFNGNEIVSIVQGNQNKRVFLKDLISQIFNLGVSDFVNITDKYDAPNISLEEAIRFIPSRARKEGQVITFLDRKDHWHIYQFKGALNQWNVLDTWEDLFDWEKLIIDSILPDEEDLTKSEPDANGNSYLSLKDREYKPEDFSGFGRVILRKNIVEIEDPIYGKDKKNILYQGMFTQANTIYEIRYDFDLGGDEITIPEGCVLDFQGGTFSNGNINGTNTEIIYSGSIFNNMIISGTWNVPIVDSVMFKDLSNDNDLKNLFNLTNKEIQNNVIIRNNSYNYIVSFSYLYESCINLNSNTHIILQGTIVVRGNEFNGYRVFFGSGVNNIKIEGSGNIIGDFYNNDEIIPSTGKHDLSKTQDYNGQTLSTHEYCHGIIMYNCVDCEITGINISRFPGDGIAIAQLNNGILSNNIIIHNSKIHDCRRLGVSVVGVRNAIIENNEIYRIKGTSPQAAIDIEPNSAEQSSYNTFIRNNYIHDCHEGIFMVGHHGWVKNVSIINNNIKNIENYGIYTSSRSNDPSDDNSQGVSNINILNNHIEAKAIALNINKCRNVNIDNNYAIADSIGGYFNPANNGIKLTNNIIKGKGIGILSASNITILGNIISGEKEGTGIDISAQASYGSQISCNNIIGKIKLYTHCCNFSFNTITQKASPELFNNVGGALISIVNNNFTVEESENVSFSNPMDSILRVNSSNNIFIENNVFNIPDNIINSPIYIANSVSKASIKYNTFNGLALSQTIANYGTNIILEGLYSNFKEGTSVPEYKGQNRDTQSTQVVYVDSNTHKLIISDGSGNQYNALGESI